MDKLNNEIHEVIRNWQPGMPTLSGDTLFVGLHHSENASSSQKKLPRISRSESVKLDVDQELRLKKELEELAVFEKSQRNDPNESDPVKLYQRRLNAKDAVKVYSKKDFGFRIVENTRTEQEQTEIDKSNLDILKFVYGKIGKTDNRLDDELLEKVDSFLSLHEKKAFRTGALSVAIDFDMFPPKLKWRNCENNLETILLRPVVVDGVAVHYSTRTDCFRPFYCKTRNNMIYSHDLVLSVKPLFDIVVGFLIRGHKTIIYLPSYYQKRVTDSGLSKVDDVFAFTKLVELGFVEFRNVAREGKFGKWFQVVSRIADQKEAVFVSSNDYRNKNDPCEYLKPSERILTPCFLNTKDHLMVLQTTIRYRGKNNKFVMIPSEEILYCSGENDITQQLGAQMYLNDQINLICSLCQLYPMNSLHKVSIKQLLRLVISAQSEFEMPHMTFRDLDELENKYAK